MSLRDGVSILFERHAQALLGSLGRLARQPFATLLTVIVIGIALALPAALCLAVANMRVVDRRARRHGPALRLPRDGDARRPRRGKRAQSIAELPASLPP